MKKKLSLAVAALALLLPVSASATSAVEWTEVIDDAFDTGSVGGDPHGNVNGWYDTAGDTWESGLGELVVDVDEADAWGTYTLFRNLLPDEVDQRIAVEIAEGVDPDAPYLGLVLRHQDADNFYLAQASDQYLFVYKVEGGAITSLTNAYYGETADSDHGFRLDFSAVGTSTTVLTARLTDLTTGRVLGSAAVADNTAAMQAAGAAGITAWGTGSGGVIDRAYIYTGEQVALGGSGDAEGDPALIDDCLDLYALHYESVREETDGRYYALTDDVGDCGEDLPLPIGGSFGGELDGRGHSVSGIGIDSAIPLMGLFQQLNGAAVRDLDLRVGAGTTTIRGFYDVGALAGQAHNSTIENVTSDLDIYASDNQAGGLIGEAYSTVFTGVEVTSDIFGHYAVGGIAAYVGGNILMEESWHVGNLSATNDAVGGLIGDGYDDGAEITINESYHRGDITSDGGYVGGLVGATSGLTLDDTYATGGIVADGENVGGLVGYVNGTLNVETSYATGTVAAIHNVGGLFGWLSLAGGSYIGRSYADVDVDATGEYVGGFVGALQGTDLPVEDSYALGDVSGDLNVGGFAGYLDYVSIVSSYAAGLVSGGNYTGGFVGLIEEANETTISDSFAAGELDLSDSDHFGQFAGNFGGSVVFSNNYALGDELVAPPAYCVAVSNLPYPSEVDTGGCEVVGLDNQAYFQGSDVDEAGHEPTASWDWDDVWHTVSDSFPELLAFSDAEPEEDEEVAGGEAAGLGANGKAPSHRRSSHRSGGRAERPEDAAPVATSTPAAASSFARDLELGMEGADVAALQAFLVAQGHLTMPAGAAPGFFGPLTRAALVKFQLASNVSPAVGYFGPITRKVVEILLGIR